MIEVFLKWSDQSRTPSLEGLSSGEVLRIHRRDFGLSPERNCHGKPTVDIKVNAQSTYPGYTFLLELYQSGFGTYDASPLGVSISDLSSPYRKKIIFWGVMVVVVVVVGGGGGWVSMRL